MSLLVVNTKEEKGCGVKFRKRPYCVYACALGSHAVISKVHSVADSAAFPKTYAAPEEKYVFTSTQLLLCRPVHLTFIYGLDQYNFLSGCIHTTVLDGIATIHGLERDLKLLYSLSSQP